MARHRSGSIRVQVWEVIDQIDDEDLLHEVKTRKLILPSNTINEPTDMELVQEAYEELLRGRGAEARSILHALIYPKWKNVRACTDALLAIKS
jgi:hypothetical protein